jgi:V/A-type H+-transporting ATPase subunit I
MAIAQMAKVIIVTHRSHSSDLLEALQREGICQILNAEQAIVTRDSPELITKPERPKDIEELINRLDKSIAFLKSHSTVSKGISGVFAPRVVVDEQAYRQVVTDTDVLKIVERCEKNQASLEKTKATIDSLQNTLDTLEQWSSLETPVEQLSQLRNAICWPGLVPSQHYERVQEGLAELGAALQEVGFTANKYACLIVCLKENIDPVQKLLRSAEFEPISFEGMTGTVELQIHRHRERWQQAQEHLQELENGAVTLSNNLLKLQVLHDHYKNLLGRERTKDSAPATTHTLIFESWVKKKDYARLERIITKFPLATLSEIAPSPDEEIPVDIENKAVIRPFEFITRLYGMPQSSNVDPTAFLAPFFALFFGICLGDAGYGVVMLIAAVLLARKLQGDKKLVRMLAICSVFAILVGVLTGSWFGDAVTKFAPSLDPLREKIMWFDPLKKPLMMFGIAMGLGYIHLMTGLLIAFVHNLKVRDYMAAFFEQLTWLVMLNSIVIFGFSKAGVLPAGLGTFCSRLAIVPAILLVLLSSRQGGWGERLGMGAYNLFSTVFYLGDVLSYLRLMALGMVSSGLGMAINVIAELTLKIPYVGIFVMLLIFIGGHSFNLILSILGGFVHTMRLQFVEFFPKFLAGGGRTFEPLRKEYEHIYMETA